MRVKAGKAASKCLGTLIFLLLFLLDSAFPKTAYAMSTLNTCARSKECLELIKEGASSAVTAPTTAGNVSTAISTTTNSGAVRTLVKGVTDFAIVTGPTAVYVGWHYWDETHNGQAQNRARELYCAAHPRDEVCVPFIGGQEEDVWYTTEVTYYHYYYYAPAGTSGTTRDRSDPNDPRANLSAYPYSDIVRDRWGPYTRRYDALGKIGGAKVLEPEGQGYHIRIYSKDTYYASFCGSYGSRCEPVQQMYHVTGNVGSASHWVEILDFKVIGRKDGQPDNSGNPPPLPWKDWPQAKRNAAVALLNNSDWQRLITSLPFGGTLDPGDTAKAPTIVIPGQEWDNPNTPLDDRRLKTVPGEYPRPVVPDFDHDSDPDETDADDDNDGVIEPYDPEPRNPYVPRASSEPPPPPDDDIPPQSEGEKAVSKVRQSYGDFLEKAENDTFENRLDTIEAKYKRAAAMEDEAAVDPNVGYEQDRLIAEADSERQQLEGELGEAWWSSLSQYEQQLFDGHPQAEIDEMQMHMKQWDQGTFAVGGVPQSVVYHAQEKGYSDYLEYLRDASNFDKSQATRTPREGLREDYTVKWEIVNSGEYLIEDQNGKTLTYGSNE